MRKLVTSKINLVKVLKKFSDDTVDVLFIKTKYVEARRFVAKNCCFVKELQPKKKTNKSTDNCKRNSTSRHYEHSF